MIVKQMNYPNTLNPDKSDDHGKKRNLKFSEIPDIMAETDKANESHLKLRLQEMEEINLHLEELVKQKTKELAEAGAINNKFISIIAHDLRSPFSSIIGILGILKESLNEYNKKEIRKFVAIADNSANRALILLDSLLAWTISQKQENHFNPVKTNLIDLLEYEMESINCSAMQKQIKLNLFVSPDLNVAADVQMVKTICRNLLSNAIKYTNEGGEITISALEAEPFVEISVKDNGIGISDNALQNLFKMDKLQSTAGTNHESGSGLGLLLCKEFIELHGGRIQVISEPEKGSDFKFTLPHYI